MTEKQNHFDTILSLAEFLLICKRQHNSAVDRKDDAAVVQTTERAEQTCAELAVASFRWAMCHMREKGLLAEFGMYPSSLLEKG